MKTIKINRFKSFFNVENALTPRPHFISKNRPNLRSLVQLMYFYGWNPTTNHTICKDPIMNFISWFFKSFIYKKGRIIFLFLSSRVDYLLFNVNVVHRKCEIPNWKTQRLIHNLAKINVMSSNTNSIIVHVMLSTVRNLAVYGVFATWALTELTNESTIAKCVTVSLP